MGYLRTTFIKNHSLIHDLLEPINDLKTPKSIKDSSENVQTVLKLVSLVKRRDLIEKVMEVHVDQIIKITLLRTDYRDYVREWSEKLSKNRRAHSTRADVLEDDGESDSMDTDEEIDLEASVREEMAQDTLANRKRFLFKFLERKLNQLKIQLSLEMRNFKEDDKEKKADRRKIQFGSVLVAEEEDLEAAFPLDEGRKGSHAGEGEKSSAQMFKICPLKCGNKFHKFGNVFSCQIFREAPVDERWGIIEKNFICSNCLQRKGKAHICRFKRSCRFCKGTHHFMLCRKKAEEVVKMASKIDREEEEIDDPNLDHEGIFLACATAGMNLSDSSKIPETSDEESLPSEGEDTLESVFLAVTEKRRLLGIEMETNAGRMKTIGSIPPDLGRNYILKRVTQSLQEDN